MATANNARGARQAVQAATSLSLVGMSPTIKQQLWRRLPSVMAAVSFIAVCGENVHQHACWRLGYSAADFYRLWGNRRHGYGKGKLRCTVACAAPMRVPKHGGSAQALGYARTASVWLPALPGLPNPPVQPAVLANRFAADARGGAARKHNGNNQPRYGPKDPQQQVDQPAEKQPVEHTVGPVANNGHRLNINMVTAASGANHRKSLFLPRGQDGL